MRNNNSPTQCHKTQATASLILNQNNTERKLENEQLDFDFIIRNQDSSLEYSSDYESLNKDRILKIIPLQYF